MRAKGKITSWNDEKGFGFITPDGGGKQIFVHIKALSSRNRRPDIHEMVTYVLSTGKEGRPCAAEVLLAGVNGN
ncbi:MAG: cold shock domain-containing protein [Thermodesulfobacteriota bacterium]